MLPGAAPVSPETAYSIRVRPKLKPPMAELVHETCARARLDTSLQSPMKYTQE